MSRFKGIPVLVTTLLRCAKCGKAMPVDHLAAEHRRHDADWESWKPGLPKPEGKFYHLHCRPTP